MHPRIHLQAFAFKQDTKNGTRTVRESSTYPPIPAAWPSRAVRRAVKYAEHLVPSAWKQFVLARPMVRQAIAAL